jgi:uncharacterized membrane protein
MKFRPFLIAVLALNAVLISAVAGGLVGSLGAVRDVAVGRAAGLRAEAAAVVATFRWVSPSFRRGVRR